MKRLILVSALLAWTAVHPVRAQEFSNYQTVDTGDPQITKMVDANQRSNELVNKTGTAVVVSSDWSNQTSTYMSSYQSNSWKGEEFASVVRDVNVFIGNDKPDYSLNGWKYASSENIHGAKGSRSFWSEWDSRDFSSMGDGSPKPATLQEYAEQKKIPVWTVQVQHDGSPNANPIHAKIRVASPDGRYQVVIDTTYTDETSFMDWVNFFGAMLSSATDKELRDNLPMKVGLAASFSGQFHVRNSAGVVTYAGGDKFSNAGDTFPPIPLPTTSTGQATKGPAGTISGNGGS
ncbi:MAG: hypothetical protein ACM30I_13630 [Gemmatimonas sp.]